MGDDLIHILIIDDEESLRWVLGKTLERPEYKLYFADSAEAGEAAVKAAPIDFAMVDINLPGDDGLTFLARMRKQKPEMLVAVITGEGTMDTAITAMREGAYDYLTKPFDIDEIESLAERAAQSVRNARAHTQKGPRAKPARSVQASDGAPELIGRSHQIREIHKGIGRIAASDVTVLILGESGTGKELIASAIHRYSHQADSPFIAVNCAAIPRELLEAELFGHEKGAFTGATERKVGKLEAAAAGTIFLDEIGDMPLELQAKMLRVLQEREYQRVGGTQTMPLRARVVAATNRNLAAEVERGNFREDLFYRLNGFIIHSAPLREIREDIPLLVDHFFRVFARKLGHPTPRLTPEAQRRLTHHDWPGNVRELENVVKSLTITSPTTLIGVEGLPKNIRGQDGEAPQGRAFERQILQSWRPIITNYCEEGRSGLLQEASDTMERPIIRQVLMQTGWNQVRSAQILGINRNTLRSKMKHLGIQKPDGGGAIAD